MRIREAIRLIETDGWFLVATRGSHRQYKHPVKLGRVTIAGKPGDELAPGNAEQRAQTSGSERESLVRFAVVIEKADGNYSAYVPDLPGCVATGQTAADATANICEAIRFHLDGLREDGVQLPQPEALCDYVDA